MVKVLLDTCILIDYLNGIAAARTEIERHENPAISIITWMEVMAGAAPDIERQTRAFLREFLLIEIDASIAERAVAIRQLRRIKLPDAIIQASAEIHDMLLVTRNVKDFPSDLDFVRIPYEV